jgi:hypothetical protein
LPVQSRSACCELVQYRYLTGAREEKNGYRAKRSSWSGQLIQAETLA